MAGDQNPANGPVGPPRVVLGVSGGIAAYKAVEICRRLVDAGMYVAPVLTHDATRFVGPLTFSALASEPAQLSLWDEASPIPHTKLGQGADLIVVAPARRPDSGGTISTPRRSSVARFSRTEGCSHISVCMAGQTMTGARVARRVAMRRSSERPAA